MTEGKVNGVSIMAKGPSNSGSLPATFVEMKLFIGNAAAPGPYEASTYSIRITSKAQIDKLAECLRKESEKVWSDDGELLTDMKFISGNFGYPCPHCSRPISGEYTFFVGVNLNTAEQLDFVHDQVPPCPGCKRFVPRRSKAMWFILNKIDDLSDG